MSRKINILMVLAVVLTTNNVFAKKSAYIISKHKTPSLAHVYSIDSNEITLQAEIDISSYNSGYGAVGLGSFCIFLVIFRVFRIPATVQRANYNRFGLWPRVIYCIFEICHFVRLFPHFRLPV